MKTRTKTKTKSVLAEMRKLSRAGTFKSLAGPPGSKVQECMIRVSWSGLNDPGDRGAGHTVRRGEVVADLGLDSVPDPPFTTAEMQEVARAAKFAALDCLRRRGHYNKGADKCS